MGEILKMISVEKESRKPVDDGGVKTIHMTPEERERLAYLLEHPEVFDEARARFETLARNIELVPVPEGEELWRQQCGCFG